MENQIKIDFCIGEDAISLALFSHEYILAEEMFYFAPPLVENGKFCFAIADIGGRDLVCY
jgi:hypothetical protein